MEDKDILNSVVSSATSGEDNKYLTFLLDNEFYGIDIRQVVEILNIQIITNLPKLPSFIKGVINLRGKVVPVIDVRIRFELDELAYNERTSIVVVECDEKTVGLIVDNVSEVITINAHEISPLSKIYREKKSRFLKGLGKAGSGVKILLNIEEMLTR